MISCIKFGEETGLGAYHEAADAWQLAGCTFILPAVFWLSPNGDSEGSMGMMNGERSARKYRARCLTSRLPGITTQGA
jgi:hypothetical protein